MTASPSDTDRRIRVRLGDLGLAPENLRFEAPADEGVPRLADTIRAAGLLYPPMVRKGRKGEAPFMVLDGRRRRYALLLRVDRGEISLDEEVECLLATDKAAQAAAAVLTNSEHAPVHLADVIVAIGKLRRTRMPTAAIAAALGYDALEIRRLEALAGVHPTVLQAFRQDRLTLRQVRLFARVRDRQRQEDLAQTALDGYFHDYQLQSLVQGSRITAGDPRFRLVGEAAYGEAGGRFEADLFGELPDVALDSDLLTTLWRTRAEALAAALGEKDVTVYLGEDRGYRAPEGLFGLPYVHLASLAADARQAFEAARARVDAARVRLEAVPDASPPPEADVSAFLLALLEAARARTVEGAVEAVLLSPAGGVGVEATFLWRPPEVEPDADDELDPEAHERAAVSAAADPAEIEVPVAPVEVGGIAHGLHEVRTDLATRGLIRALADHPAAAMTAMTAQLFKDLALQGGVSRTASALSVSATRYNWPQHPVVDTLDGEVRRRLDARRDAYRASGLRPIAFVAGLAPDEQRVLLAELVAVSLDLREARTTALRPAARAEAREIAALCGADLAAHWTPDAGFLAAHTKPQLLAMLTAMEVEDPRAGGLKKDELAALVAREAADRRWTPGAVRWDPPDAAVAADGPAAASPGEDPAAEPDDAPAAEPEIGDGHARAA